jgi:lipoate-protein ligase A
MPLLLRDPEPGLYGALARESLLLDLPGLDLPVLYLWRGLPSVVMGKNQNPWRECNLSEMKARGLRLARRVSGGGTVYQDPGNLNIAWIFDRASYRPDDAQACVTDALRALGVDARAETGGSLRVDGKKISGSAYCHRRDRVLHHGTLLWDADLEALRAVLAVPRVRMDTHAVNSVPAQVAKLQDRLPGRTPADFMDALLRQAERRWGVFGETPPPWTDQELAAETERLGSDAWIWDATPRFRVRVDLPGHGECFVTIRHGRVETLDWQGRDGSAAKGLSFRGDLCPWIARESGADAEAVRHAFARAGFLDI